MTRMMSKGLGSLAVLGLCLTVAAPHVGAEPPASVAAGDAAAAAAPQGQQGQQSGGTSAESRAQSQAQAQPEVEKQRKEAEQGAEKTLDKDAVAAVEETEKAVKAIADGKTDEAIAAIERAAGKIDILLARNPATALVPVDAEVVVIDTPPLDVKAIRERARAAEEALDDKDYPTARVLLEGLTSEIRVRTYHLPLATYPAAMKEAARLLDQKKNKEAATVLQTALNTLVIIDRGTPLPLTLAQAAIQDAQAARGKDKDAAQKHLATARKELERARELGYAGKDPEYASLEKAISDLERQLQGGQDTASAFDKLKEKMAAFYQRLSEAVKKSVVD